MACDENTELKSVETRESEIPTVIFVTVNVPSFGDGTLYAINCKKSLKRSKKENCGLDTESV